MAMDGIGTAWTVMYARWEASGCLQCAAADGPHQVVGYCVKQTGDPYLGQATQEHAVKAAILQAGMSMLGVATPLVSGLALFAIHSGAPLLETLRFGGSIAFVPSLALWFGCLLAGGWRAEHLYGGVGLRERHDVGRGHCAGVSQQSIRQLAATQSDLRHHHRRKTTIIASLDRLDRDHEAAGAGYLHVISGPHSAISHPHQRSVGIGRRDTLFPGLLAAFAAGRGRLVPLALVFLLFWRGCGMPGQRRRDTAGAIFGRREATLRQPPFACRRIDLQFLLQLGNPGTRLLLQLGQGLL